MQYLFKKKLVYKFLIFVSNIALCTEICNHLVLQSQLLYFSSPISPFNHLLLLNFPHHNNKCTISAFFLQFDVNRVLLIYQTLKYFLCTYLGIYCSNVCGIHSYSIYLKAYRPPVLHTIFL